MRIQTALSDKLKKHSSHHTFIPDWIHDCAEWENDDILIEKVEQKNKYRMSKQTFDFSEALRRMKEGKKVRRNGCYFSLSINKYKEISILYQQSSIKSFTHVVPHYWHFFSLDDILATDWEEV